VNPAAPARPRIPGPSGRVDVHVPGVLFQFLVRDEGSGALMSFEQAAQFQLAIGAHHGVGIDGEIDGELAHGGQLIAGLQRAGGDAAPYLVDELAVDRDAAVQVDGER